MSERESSPECESVLAELSAYVDDALSPAEHAAIARHLEACAACQAELELLRLIAQSLQQAPRPEPSDSMRQRLMAQVAADFAPQRVEIVCTERHGDRVVQWREVSTLRDAAPEAWPNTERAVAMPVFVLQSRREQAVRPGVYQVIESYYER